MGRGELGMVCTSGASLVTSATGPGARRGSAGIAKSYVKESKRSRWPRAVVTRRAQGGWGAIRRQNSSPMLWHRIRRPSLSGTPKLPVRGRTPLVQTILSCDGMREWQSNVASLPGTELL